jgi:adenylate cyclase
MRLDPKSPIKWRWMDGMTWAHFAAGRYEEALDWAQQSVRMNPDNEVGYRGVASSSAQLGRIDEARSALAEELRLLPALTVEDVRRVNTVTDPDFLERWLDGLRKAGLPEE